MNLFDSQIKLKQIQLKMQTVNHLALPWAEDKEDTELRYTTYATLPKQLIGDALRLKQVLVSLTRHTIRMNSYIDTMIQVAFSKEC